MICDACLLFGVIKDWPALIMPKQEEMATQELSFNEIIPGSSVRLTSDNLIYAVDLVMVISNKNNNDAGEDLRCLPKQLFDSSQLIKRNTGGRGNARTKLVSIDDALELIMVLPGKMAKMVRVQFAEIIKRYLNGDTSLCKEIHTNNEMGKRKSFCMFAHKVLTEAKKELEAPLETAYIYATYSKAFPGLVKIGRSRNVRARVSSGNTFIAPTPHRVICVAPTLNAKRDEEAAHAFFASFRKEGEFFELDHDDVENYFKTITANYQKEHMDLLVSSRDSVLVW